MRITTPVWEYSASDRFVNLVEEFVAGQGGADTVMRRMEEIGMGAVARAWSSGATNEPVSSERLHQIFGTGVLRAFAAKLELQPRELVRRLAQNLPRVMFPLTSLSLGASALGRAGGFKDRPSS